MQHAVTVLSVSIRRACRVSRATQQYVSHLLDDEAALRQRIVELAREYGRYGYLRITVLLREEGLKVPQKHPKRARPWLADGSCVRRRPTHPHHVWAYDFVMDRTHDGRSLKMLTVIDEYTRECIAIAVRRRMRAIEVQEVLGELFLVYGCPQHIRSDKGPEFIIECWQRRYNHVRPHSALGYRPPAPQTIEPHPLYAGLIEHVA